MYSYIGGVFPVATERLVTLWCRCQRAVWLFPGKFHHANNLCHFGGRFAFCSQRSSFPYAQAYPLTDPDSRVSVKAMQCFQRRKDFPTTVPWACAQVSPRVRIANGVRPSERLAGGIQRREICTASGVSTRSDDHLTLKAAQR